MELIDVTPSPQEFAHIGATLLRDVAVHKMHPLHTTAAAAMLTSVLDVVRYLAVIDQRDGTHYLDALMRYAALDTVPPSLVAEDRDHD